MPEGMLYRRARVILLLPLDGTNRNCLKVHCTAELSFMVYSGCFRTL